MSGGSLNSSWGSWGGLQVCLQVVSIVWWGTLAFYGWGWVTEARGDPMLVLHWYSEWGSQFEGKGVLSCRPWQEGHGHS